MLQNIHSWCCRRSLAYHRWHKHPLHPHAHWGCLSVFVIASGFWLGVLGWRDVGYDPDVFLPAAVHAQASGFDQRKSDWKSRQESVSGLDYNGLWAGRQYVLAWADSGTHGANTCRAQSTLASAFNQGTSCTNNAEGTCMLYVDSSNGIEKMLDGSYNDLHCIDGNIPGLIEWANQSGSFTPSTLARLVLQYSYSNSRLQQFFNGIPSDQYFFDASPSDTEGSRDMQPIKTVVHYLAAMKSPGAQVMYENGGNGFTRTFSYGGITYTPGSGPYNALSFSRNWMYAWLEEAMFQPSAEANSRSYQSRAISAARLLYDFGEPEMKKRAKMFLDFLFIDAGAQFSVNVNQWSGLLGRTYRSAYAGGGDTMPWYVYWGANSENGLAGDGYVSSYRLSPLVEVFPNVNGGDWMLKRDSYRNNVFTTNAFSLAAGFGGGDWRITMRGSSGNGFPFDIWISDFAGDLDGNACGQAGNIVNGRTVSTCGGSECYTCLGANGYLYRNNIFFENLSSPTLHFTSWQQSFDQIQGKLQSTGDFQYEYFLNNNQWNYLQEGKTGVAIWPGPGAGAVEVAVVDGSCSDDFCYPSFSDFTSRSRSIGGLSFTNGKGVVVSASNAYTRPSQRLTVQTNDSGRYVSWANNVMTVANNGTCQYDFNNWTTTPAGCEGQGGTLGTGNPQCPDGLCNGSETELSCPADCTNTSTGGSCGNPGDPCSVGSCQGTCDSSGNQCTIDPNCNSGGGGGSPPNKPLLCYCPNGSCPAQCTGTGTGGPICGQNGCEVGETAQSCPQDCGSGPTCNNNTYCDPGETPTNCPNDCQVTQVCTPGGSCQFAGSCPGTCSADGSYCGDAVPNDNCPNYASGHRYPRLSHTTWGGPVIDWLKRFDLIDNNANNNPAYPSAIKAANATTKIVVTRDFNQGLSMEADKYTQWKVTTSNVKGKKFCSLYFLPDPSRNDPGDFYFNYTDLAPPIPTEYGTMRYNEYISRWMTDPKNIDLSVFDGVQTDGLWAGTPYFGRPQCDDGDDNEVDVNGNPTPDGKVDYPADPQCASKEDNSEDDPAATPFNPCYDDIDLDGNGANDYIEHGEPWVDQQIHSGAVKVLQLLRQELDKKRPGLLMIINSGGPHEWGIQYTSGFEHEHFPGHFGFQYNKDVYDNWMLNGYAPQSPILTSDTIMGSPIKPGRNDFQLMRYGLSFALLTGAYYDFADYARSAEHYWVHYYDEYDVDLGYPTGPALPLPNGAWVRFFSDPSDPTNTKKGGVTITNGNDAAPVTVTASQLQGLSGYNGPYYRFLGGQDPVTNNGTLFDSVTLSLRQALVNGEKPTISDGIVLVREPNMAVVSDIILDNWNSGTSPGSLSPGDPFENTRTAQTFADFKQASSCTDASGYYTVRCEIREDSNGNPEETYSSPPYALALNSSAKAEYTPTIGVAGKYEVFEWHGKLVSGAANGVSHVINGASFVSGGCGSATCPVNQTANEGKWNSLGIFQFPKGSSANVTIAASGASGTVIADAIKFVYKGP